LHHDNTQAGYQTFRKCYLGFWEGDAECSEIVCTIVAEPASRIPCLERDAAGPAALPPPPHSVQRAAARSNVPSLRTPALEGLDVRFHAKNPSRAGKSPAGKLKQWGLGGVTKVTSLWHQWAILQAGQAAYDRIIPDGRVKWITYRSGTDCWPR